MTRIVPPGSTIGIFGGGQLGRMTSMAARALGYHIRILDPDPECAARPVADGVVTAGFDDPLGAAELARASDVVTLEIEKIAPASLRAAALYAPVRPDAHVIEIVQDRGRQKRWLAEHGFPMGAYRDVHSAGQLATAVTELDGAVFVKSCAGGYDGRGQALVDSPDYAHAAWRAIGGGPAVAERAQDLELELSVMVARAPNGEMVVFPPAVNHHEDRILVWSVLPGVLPPEIISQATDLSCAIADQIGLEGLLAVELFLLRDGALLVNELAPRPHNSFHATERACVTSQFEQHVRSVCGLPLGSTEIVTPAAIVNLLGDLWNDGPPRFERALRLPGVRLHLYGKTGARPGRKMGHLSAMGATPQEAVTRAQEAMALLHAPVRSPA
ncbi:MAG TPA: 5-(carboxyamino)imidazole ribonucleotide synthase [Gemmatimonadaceae bacterium]|nr:5-(carboxyamino)imidazole ribonucleotide synthase [Gemmatimonadaceae bacterium]